MDDWFKQWGNFDELQKSKQKFKWERLPNDMSDCNLYRAKLPGGWLILIIYSKPQSVPVQVYNNEGQAESYVGYQDSPPNVSSTFFPDPDHQWDGTTLD